MNKVDALLIWPAKAFLNWWLMELRSMFLAVLRKARLRRAALVIAFSDEGASFLLRTSRKTETLSTINLLQFTEKQRRMVLAALPAAVVRSGRSSIRIRLPAHKALRTTIKLPLAAEQNLGEVVGFELDRHTPFRSDEVHFTYQIKERNRDTQIIQVALTVVPRPVVDAAVAMVHSFGFDADCIEIPHEASSSSDELPLAKSRGRYWIGPRSCAAMLMAGLTIAVAAYASFNDETEALEELTSRTNIARSAAMKAQDLRNAIEQSEKEKFVGEPLHHLAANEWLAEITRMLPDDTSLTRLQLSSRRIILTGHAASSSNVLKLLEASPHFSSPTFVTPVTQDGVTGKDEFSASAVIRGTK